MKKLFRISAVILLTILIHSCKEESQTTEEPQLFPEESVGEHQKIPLLRIIKQVMEQERGHLQVHWTIFQEIILIMQKLMQQILLERLMEKKLPLTY